MNLLKRTAWMMIVLCLLVPASLCAQTNDVQRDTTTHPAVPDTTRGLPSVRIPGQTPSSHRDSLALPNRDTSRSPGSQAVRSAIPVKPDTSARIIPFRSVGSLSPASEEYTSINAAGILWKDYRTLTDLLAALPGVYVADKGSPGQNNPVSFTGAGQAATGFLVDGLEHNDPSTRSYDFALFPVEAIDRLEIVSGTRAFLYGDNTAGGAVNVVTKSFSNNRPYTRIRYSQAANSYVQTDALFSQNIFSRFNLMFGLSYLGYGLDNAANLYPGRFVNAANQAYSFRTKLRYNLSSTLNLVFTDYIHQTQTDLNGGLDLIHTAPADWYNEAAAQVINRDSYEKRFNHHAALTGIYRPTGDSTLSASVSVFDFHLLDEYRDEENRLKPNGIFVHDNFESAIYGAHARVDWTWGGNGFSASAEAKQIDFFRSLYGPALTEARQHVSIKDEISPFRFFTVAGFLKVENGQSQILENFGADARMQVSDILSATAGASQSHRHPTQAEQYLASGAADTTIRNILALPSPIPLPFAHRSLSDEIHHVVEFALRLTPREQFTLGLSASRRMIDQWIDNSLIAPRQDQNITFDIVTASLQTHLGRFFLDASLEYTHQSDVLRADDSYILTHDTTTVENPSHVLLYPKWRGQCSLYFRGPLANGNLDLKAGLNARFVSAYDGQPDRFADGVPNAVLPQSIGNAGVLDLFIIAHIGDAQIHVIWENVTNTGYMLAPFYPMYDRGFRFGVGWEFWD
jgi:outer membrane receptor protein involved in Fe transport